MQESTFVELESMFLALGDKTRLKLLALMSDGPVAVGFLANRLGESQPKVSRHLASLRNAGLVSTHRDGKWIYYEINYPQDVSTRRILDRVIRSIAVMRVGGEDVFLKETEMGFENTTNTYGDKDMTYAENAYLPGEDAEEGYREEDREIDIFLL